MHHGVAERFEARDGKSDGRRSERRPETLVGALMRIDPGGDRRIERIGRREFDPSVIAQRRVKRDRARGDLDREPVQPGLRDEIEQRRGGDQIDRPVKRGFEIAVEVERDGGNGGAFEPRRGRSAR